jgi:putative flippase GtrA
MFQEPENQISQSKSDSVHKKTEIFQLFNRDFIFQALKYGSVGVAGITSNLALFSFLVYVVKVWYMIAGPIAGFFAMTQNFILHRKFTFKNYSTFKIRSYDGLKRYLKFFALSVFNTPLFSSLLYFQVEVLHIPKVISQLTTSVIVGFISFMISRKFIFR